jgi:hypothetical protein
MRDDDEILDAYERELEDAERPRPARRPHGFGIVVGSLLLACVVLLVEIFANRSIGNDIGTAQHDLRVAQSGATRILALTGAYSEAGAVGLVGVGGNSYVGASTPSSGLGNLSVYAADNTWAAAVQARPGACFYLRLDVGKRSASFGSGTVCTGDAALSAHDTQW